MKTALRHFSRGIAIGLEIAACVAIAAFLAWCVLLWRLSQGPLEVDFLATRLEQALNAQRQDLKFDVGHALLVWGGRFEPFEIEIRDLTVARPDATPVLSVDKLGVMLSKRNLALARLVPRAVKVYAPSLRVMRWEDGHVTLNMQEAPTSGEETLPATSADQTGLIRDFLYRLREREAGAWFSGLQAVEVTGASLVYEDKALGVIWQAPSADIVFSRRRAGLSADIRLALDIGAAQPAAVQITAHHAWDTHKTEMNISFAGVSPAAVAQQSGPLRELAAIDLPMKGSVTLDLNADLRPGAARFAFGADAGTFNAMGFYQKPIPVKSVYLRGSADFFAGAAEITELRADLGGPRMEASAEIVSADGVKAVSVHAALLDMPMDALKDYWPETLTPDPRAWVTEHLSKGIATRATLEAELSYDPAAETKASLRTVSGEIDFHGVRVDYFPPLPPVTETKGKAFYDRKSFNLDIISGKLDDMDVTQSKIRITGLDTQNETNHSHIDIDVALNGPLRTALKVLDSDPLKYPARLGLKTAEVGGKAVVNVNFKFPLHKALAMDEVQVHADAKLDDVMLKDIAAGYGLSGGPMDLTVDNGALNVKGSGSLGHMPVSFDWTKSFKEGAAPDSRVTAKLPLDAEAMAAFGVPADLGVVGTMRTEIDYTVTAAKEGHLVLRGDLGGTSFSLPFLNAAKPAMAPGSLALELRLRDDKPYALSNLDLKADGVSVKGDAEFANGTIRRASFSQLKVGETDIALAVENFGEAGYKIDISGAQLDASALFKDDAEKTPNSDAEAAERSPPLQAALNLDRLLTGKTRGLERVKASFDRNAWRRLDRLEVDAIAGGKPLLIRYLPQPVGHSLSFDAGNAGAAVSILGLNQSIRGGRLVIDGKTGAKGGARDLKGTVSLTNFVLKDAPVVAKLLNAMSLSGIQSLLGGEGIAFKKARASFEWIDRGQPAQEKNVRILRLREGQTSGASLGLTFEGAIDNWKDSYDLNGTIIPVSDLNKLVAAIPLVGDVLTAGGEGMIAATYTITGPKEQPTVTVNPLAALAPGILRKLFFEQ